MKPLILLLAAAATIGAAPSRPATPAPRYEAGGFEPSWSLVIEHGRMTFDPNTGQPVVNVPLPGRQAIRNGYRYVTRELSVTVRHVRCDSYDGRTFADTVRPSLAVEEGCGGTPIPPPTLADSGWEIESVAGQHPREQSTYHFGFGDGRINIQIGCHAYSATYREQRPVLTVGRLTSTAQHFCWTSGLEGPLLAILRNPVRMSWVDGDTLVLTNRTGSLRLVP